MEFVIGIVFAIAVGIATTLIGMDRDRALYPATLIVIAFLYELFAVIGGSHHALIVESAFAVIFIGLAVAGFKRTLWFTVIGLAGHGVFDLFHRNFVDNPGVPAFWPMFCLAYDVAAAAYLALLISRDRIRHS